MSFPIRPDSQSPAFLLSRIPPVQPGNALIAGMPLQGNPLAYTPSLSSGTMFPSSRTLEMLTSGAQGKSRTDAIHVRWELQSMPLGIYIESDSSGLAEIVFEQASQWENSSILKGTTAPLLRFQRLYHINEEQQPDIVIKMASTAVPGRENETGHTDRTVDARGFIRHVSITLLERPVIYSHLSKQEQTLCLQATLLHEIGHALGLEHSQHQSDIMHYRGWRNTIISQGDRAALLALYARPEAFLA